MGIFELLVISDSLRKVLINASSVSEFEQLARKECGSSLMIDGMDRVKRGLTSLEELLRIVTFYNNLMIDN